MFQNDLPSQLIGSGEGGAAFVNGFGEQEVSKDPLELVGGVPLHGNGAVLLQGEDHGVFGGSERVVPYRYYHFPKPNFCAPGVSVSDPRKVVRTSVPQIQLDAAAATAHDPHVGLHAALRGVLVPGEVGVVRGVDPVLRERVVHVPGV